MADIHVNKLEENHYEDENEKLGDDDDNENNKICLMQKTLLSHCDVLLVFGLVFTILLVRPTLQTLLMSSQVLLR